MNELMEILRLMESLLEDVSVDFKGRDLLKTKLDQFEVDAGLKQQQQELKIEPPPRCVQCKIEITGSRWHFPDGIKCEHCATSIPDGSVKAVVKYCTVCGVDVTNKDRGYQPDVGYLCDRCFTMGQRSRVTRLQNPDAFDLAGITTQLQRRLGEVEASVELFDCQCIKGNAQALMCLPCRIRQILRTHAVNQHKEQATNIEACSKCMKPILAGCWFTRTSDGKLFCEGCQSK